MPPWACSGRSPKPYKLGIGRYRLGYQWVLRLKNLENMQSTAAPRKHYILGVSVLGGPLSVMKVWWAASNFKATPYYSLHPLSFSDTHIYIYVQSCCEYFRNFHKMSWTSFSANKFLGSFVSFSKCFFEKHCHDKLGVAPPDLTSRHIEKWTLGTLGEKEQQLEFRKIGVKPLVLHVRVKSHVQRLQQTSHIGKLFPATLEKPIPSLGD